MWVTRDGLGERKSLLLETFRQAQAGLLQAGLHANRNFQSGKLSQLLGACSQTQRDRWPLG